MQIDDFSLPGILNCLTAKAWSKQCVDPEGSFLLSPSELTSDGSADSLRGILRRLYDHARRWAPGFEVPVFVPPVRILESAKEAGHFLLDGEGYASVAVSKEFLGSPSATCLILAHEASHHILLQSGISYQFKNNVSLNERVTDLAMFVYGFGDIAREGHAVVRRGNGRFVNTHLGYLDSREYETAFRYVVEKRRALHLPGVERQTPVRTTLIGQWRRVFKTQSRPDRGDSLLDRVVQETERRNRERDGTDS